MAVVLCSRYYYYYDTQNVSLVQLYVNIESS